MKRTGLKSLLIWIALLTGLGGVPGEAQRSRDKADQRVDELIANLKLTVLPRESGYLGIIGRSAQTVTAQGKPLAAQSQNYYMLTRELPINYLHWLASDDTHILLEGGPVDYFIFHPDGSLEKITLGTDLVRGQRAVVAIPGGCWKAIRLHEGAGYALMVNVLSPEFTPDRVRVGEGEGWVKRYAGKAPWASPEQLRSFIGPNWIP